MLKLRRSINPPTFASNGFLRRALTPPNFGKALKVRHTSFTDAVWQPLTAAVVFGLAFATVLTLVVIPVCYSVAYSVQPAAAAVLGAPQVRDEHCSVQQQLARLLDQLGFGDDAVELAPAALGGDAEGGWRIDEGLDIAPGRFLVPLPDPGIGSVEIFSALIRWTILHIGQVGRTRQQLDEPVEHPSDLRNLVGIRARADQPRKVTRGGRHRQRPGVRGEGGSANASRCAFVMEVIPPSARSSS